MSLTKVISDLTWAPGQGFDTRAATVFSDSTKVRLDPNDFHVKLKVQDDFLYPMDADLFIRTPVAHPGAARRLLILQVESNVPEGTSVALRLWDGTRDLFWDGSDWTVPGAGDWNTEAEVNAHLLTFPLDPVDPAIAVTFNLVSADGSLTPDVSSVLVLWEGDFDWMEDLLEDSLTAMVQENATFLVKMALPPLPAAADEIDLDDYRDEAGLDFVTAEAVYDHAADPHHLTNLLDSYNPTSKVLALTAEIPVDGVPFLCMTARAQVAWDTNQDFTELGKLPQVVLRDVDTVSSSMYPPSADRGIVRKDDGTGVEILAPYRTTLRVTMEVRTNRSREQARLLGAMTRLLTAGPVSEAGPFLRSRATDRRFRILLTDHFSARPLNLDVGDVRAFTSEFTLEDLTQQVREARDAHGITRLMTRWVSIDAEREQDALERGVPVPTSSPETFENM
jgi:hypothetical protein